MKNPYPVVSEKNPFYYIVVSGIDLSTIATTGDTKLQVYRVWKYATDKDTPSDGTSFNMPPDYVSPYNVPPYYAGSNTITPIDPVDFVPIEQRKNRFTFVMDDTLFTKLGGRYRGDFYYKGTYISSAYFTYSKLETAIAGSANV